MADTQSILQLGIEAVRSGDKAEARELFRLVTREDANNAQGWMWLAGVAEDREERRAALERVVQIEPNNELARKGLAALGGTRSTVVPDTSMTTPIAPVDTSRAAPPRSADDDLADAFDSIDTYAAAPESGRARVYDQQPQQVGGYVPPDFGDDDFDLGEYENRPRVTAADIDQRERGRDTVVVVDDDDDRPRRRGLLSWLPLLLALLLLGVLGYFAFQRLTGGTTDVANNDGNGAVGSASASGAGGVADPSGAATSSQAAGLLTSPGADASGAGQASPGGVVGGVGGVDPNASAAPVDPNASAGGGVGGVDPNASPAPVDPNASAGGGVGGVDPNASPAPVDPNASAVGGVGGVDPNASPAPVDPNASPAAPVDPNTNPPAGGDVASANPGIVGNEQVLTAGTWNFGYTGLSNVATGSYGGTTPSRGRYIIVLISTQNTSGAPVQIPDGFFVLKDAQGRVYDFNRAASVDYINRFGGTGPGGAGDYSADAQIPPNAPLGSVPLLFDVASDATNLVLFSRENTGQGFLVRQNAQ